MIIVFKNPQFHDGLEIIHTGKTLEAVDVCHDENYGIITLSSGKHIIWDLSLNIIEKILPANTNVVNAVKVL